MAKPILLMDRHLAPSAFRLPVKRDTKYEEILAIVVDELDARTIITAPGHITIRIWIDDILLFPSFCPVPSHSRTNETKKGHIV
jgi:hypothetical protein